MASTYKIFLPNGTSLLLPYGDRSEKLKNVEAVMQGWGPYLDGNWISTNHTDVFCGENKVKRFLDGLAYYLLIGSEDVVTDYKELMNGKREIPMSSCPSQINDIVYGVGAALHNQGDDEPMTPFVEEKPSQKKKTPKKHEVSQRSENLNALRKQYGFGVNMHRCRVDTSNCFSFAGAIWQIASDVESYRPKTTPLGDLYDMDAVVVVSAKDGHHFFDADYFPISDDKIRKIFG